MKVFDSLNSTHTFKVVPRYYSDVTSLVLKNEANNELKNFDPVIFSTLNGFIDITFDTSFTDKEKGEILVNGDDGVIYSCLLYTSPSPRDRTRSRMPSSA